MKIKIKPRLKWVQAATAEVTCTDWDDFVDILKEQFLDATNFVWRGQRRSGWPLESTLQRQLKNSGHASVAELEAQHFKVFRQAIRGRRGPFAREIHDEDEYWALGQHYGLNTPLLDWTLSPFVAAYFALYEPQHVNLGEDASVFTRGLCALDRNLVESRSKEVLKEHGPDAPVIRFILPESEDNGRLLSQSGLFTRIPSGYTIESWIREFFPEDYETIALVKIFLPEQERDVYLKMLAFMNVNHLALFPDLVGASIWSNRVLELNIKDKMQPKLAS
jgi:hypothetical protein